MRHSLPILLCGPNEDFRSLIREMLGKNGFFHVLEAGNSEESKDLLSAHGENALLIIQRELLNAELTSMIRKNKNFIVLSQSETEESIIKAAVLGVEHFLSFPFSSRHLMEKIESLISQ